MREHYDDTIINGLDMSLNAFSSSISVNLMRGSSVQAQWTGFPVGKIQIELSNNGVSWDILDGSNVSVSGPGSNTWSLGSFFTKFARVAYYATSGNGLLNANYFTLRDD